MTAPDLVEPLLGFRAWRVMADGRLVPWSAGMGGTWVPGENRARCLAGARHRAPAHRCTCGLYALTDLRDERLRPALEAVGAIVAWGDVEAHRTGFRAECARIVALGLPDPCPPRHRSLLDLATSHYGVPLVPVDQLDAVGREHGRPLAFDLLPDRAGRPASRAGAPPLDQTGLTGIALDEHLVVTLAARMLRVAVTPALAAHLAADVEVVLPEPGTTLRRGDPLVRLQAGDEVLLLGAPLSCRVLATGAGDGLAGELCELVPTRWDEEAGSLTWGDGARRLYAATLAHESRRGDPFRHVRATWLNAHAHVRSAGDVARELRAARERPRFGSEDEVYERVGRALSLAFADHRVALLACRAGAVVAWRLHAPDADIVIDLRGPLPDVRCGAPEPEADVVLYAAAETAHDYFAGRADLPAALRRRDVQTRAPLDSVLRIASVIKSLHKPYRAAAAI